MQLTVKIKKGYTVTEEKNLRALTVSTATKLLQSQCDSQKAITVIPVQQNLINT